ncbi:hypothetical protein A605_05925 [Corynebacterium halotolerans YIM 70093 = DSM 44683]|uniref:Uncharacterized protein n=1 Tax=Corynebacterium halotolerans YIM 70093 = DSM 44683 TaxID=1121362 RepID=M1P6A7_9CORY|nr:hypothetical protein A605_05925 [Corynebacterium halotolerans YIM 70093 = DSM 44683]
MLAVIVDVVLIVLIMAVARVPTRGTGRVFFVHRRVRVLVRHRLAVGVRVHVLIVIGMVGVVIAVLARGCHDTPSSHLMCGDGWVSQEMGTVCPACPVARRTVPGEVPPLTVTVVKLPVQCPQVIPSPRK